MTYHHDPRRGDGAGDTGPGPGTGRALDAGLHGGPDLDLDADLALGRRAGDELSAVHRRALAALLCQAARRLAGPLGVAYASLLPPVPGGWRRRARRQLALLDRDGLRLAGQDLLADLLAGRRRDPLVLVAAALDLWSSPWGLVTYGQVLLAADRPAEAGRVYAGTLGLDAGGELPWRLREGLAASWEARGRDRVALGCLEAALDRPGAGVGPLATGLFLALELGRADRAADLAGRLDTRVRPGSRRLAAVGHSLAARRRHLRPGTWAPAGGAARCFADLHAGEGAAAALCRGFVTPLGGQAGGGRG